MSLSKDEGEIRAVCHLRHSALTLASLPVVSRVPILSQLTSRLSVANCDGQLHDSEWALRCASAADQCLHTWACF